MGLWFGGGEGWRVGVVGVASGKEVTAVGKGVVVS